MAACAPRLRIPDHSDRRSGAKCLEAALAFSNWGVEGEMHVWSHPDIWNCLRHWGGHIRIGHLAGARGECLGDFRI